MLNKLHIILFGATGFTGKRIIPELNRIIKSENLSLTWGIAGRSKQKLVDVLREVENKTGDDFKNISIIQADVNNEASMVEMTSQARIVINAIGPYRFYGESVVKACLATSTNYVDITGEPGFMEMIQLNYHEEAIKKKVYLISSCGADSIPGDMGAIFLMKNFKGTLNSIEAYMQMMTEGGTYPGPVFNYATWESAIHGIANSKDLSKIRSQLFSKQLPPSKPKLEAKKAIFKNNVTGKWSLPFPGADRSVMLRTQRFFHEENNQRPIQIQCYFDFENYYNAFLTVLMGSIFATMSKYEWTRSILLKHPKLFSLGVFSLGGPSDEKLEHMMYNLYLEGKGWNGSTDRFILPDKKILAKVSTKNPAYGATCTAAVLSAITVLTESEKMPNQGGCYTPGAAFCNTSLIEKLHKYGMKFEIRSKL